jgi:sRNA-binding regulator protein Hfq
MRLAARLGVTQEQLEERLGKSMSLLNRPEARDWIKRVRAMADEIAPSRKVRFGQWPEEQEDMEATYLREQREAGAPFTFKLFNGEEFSGVIADSTPYTITIKANDGGEVVLRKLAIAYYRRLPEQSVAGEGVKKSTRTARTKKAGSSDEAPHDHARDNHHQPLDSGLDSDRVGEPKKPEKDRMDEDRGV